MVAICELIDRRFSRREKGPVPPTLSFKRPFLEEFVGWFQWIPVTRTAQVEKCMSVIPYRRRGLLSVVVSHVFSLALRLPFPLAVSAQVEMESNIEAKLKAVYDI
jgi:hypothetical protein